MNPIYIDAEVLKAGDKIIYIFGNDKRKRKYQCYLFELLKNDDDVIFYQEAAEEDGKDKFWDMKKKEMVVLN